MVKDGSNQPSQRAVMRWAALVALLHLLLGAGVGLSVDEAHYLLYAAHWDWSYFDHPPLVGWVQWPLVASGAGVVALRLVPGVVWLATVWGVYRLCLRLFAGQAQAAQVAAASVWLLLLAPLLHILGIGLLPDTLLMAWVVALMHQTWTLMQADAAQRWAPWCVLGALLGLAGLSKYTAIFPALALALCLLQAHGPRLLLRPQPWAAVALALLWITPVLGWNAQHEWASFAYQAQHGAGSQWRALEVLRFLIVQILAYGPLWLLALYGWHTSRGRVRRMGAFFALPFAVLAYMAGGGSSLPHWTAPAWVAAAPFAARAWVQAAQSGAWRRGLLRGLAVAQALAGVGLLGLMVSGGWPWLPQTAAHQKEGANPFADLHGWEEAGARARLWAQQMGAGRLAVQNWTLASRLGWYARPLPVHVLAPGKSQFDYWAGALPAGSSAIVLDWSYLSYLPPLGAQGFERCELLEESVHRHWGQPLGAFRYYLCTQWRGGPGQPRLTLGG